MWSIDKIIHPLQQDHHVSIVLILFTTMMYAKVFYLAPFAHVMVCSSEFDKELDIDILFVHI